MPKIDIGAIPVRPTPGYPIARERVEGIARRGLGDAAGLTKIGVNLTRIPEGVASSLRHWHEVQDEFVFVVSGEVVLMDDDGETVLRAGDAAGFRAGIANGHRLVNRGPGDAHVLEVSNRVTWDRSHYVDDDLEGEMDHGARRYSRPSGEAL